MSMSRLTAFCVAALLATGVVFAQTPAKKPAAAKGGSVADRLMANEQKIQDALIKKDMTTFNSLIMPGTWAVDENGPMKVEDFTKNITDLKIESAKLSDMKVITISPTVSVVTYKMDQKGTYEGHPFPPVVYASSVWVNHGGTWMAMFHQESTAAPAVPAKK